MAMAPRTRSLIARDTLAALLVLALALLNFGHASAAFAAGGRVVVSAPSICGDPAAPNAADHFACHACRPDDAALPPPPGVVAPACFVVTAVEYAAPVPFGLSAAPLRTASARAPPIA